jgi:iron complex outermembrane receptor protein
VLDRLRRPLATRLAAPALLLGLALGWAAPARAAHAWAEERAGAAALLAADDTARVEAALVEAAARAASPADFAAEVVRALAARPAADLSPAADALLRALYAHILQAMRLGQGPQAVLLAARPDVAAVPAAAPLPAPGVETPRPVALAAVRPERAVGGLAPLPREARPQVQPLGP